MSDARFDHAAMFTGRWFIARCVTWYANLVTFEVDIPTSRYVRMSGKISVLEWIRCLRLISEVDYRANMDSFMRWIDGEIQSLEEEAR